MKHVASITAFLLTLFVTGPAATVNANENNPDTMRVFKRLFPGKNINEAHEELAKEFGNVPASTMYDLAMGMHTVDKSIETKLHTKDEGMKMLLQDAKARGYEHLLDGIDRLQFYAPFWTYYEAIRCMDEEDPGMWNRAVEETQKKRFNKY